ncbi:hypothetical protein NC653_022248 [Populus alba x Populus x berolinensis]|uniref:Uncharacterized protein n=1 Tax=Populus alba x Populus x berolinensis TaxID=444605 RepID=A0AAD6Q999_9ROSI|nr:hypothetical protein NC653_022248 [Populus alba x Populus x berolinensis]
MVAAKKTTGPGQGKWRHTPLGYKTVLKSLRNSKDNVDWLGNVPVKNNSEYAASALLMQCDSDIIKSVPGESLTQFPSNSCLLIFGDLSIWNAASIESTDDIFV